MKKVNLFTALIYNIIYYIETIWNFITRKKRKIVLKFQTIKTSRRVKRENERQIEKIVANSLIRNSKSAYNKALVFLFFIAFTVACNQEEVKPDPQNGATVTTPSFDPDTMVKFTLYSKRVPFIWKIQVKGAWVQDTIKTNDAIRYEIFDDRNRSSGVGYFVTMNLNGISTDSLHIIGEYKGKLTQMASPSGQSAAYVLLNAIGPK